LAINPSNFYEFDTATFTILNERQKLRKIKNETFGVLSLIAVTILWGWSFVVIHESLMTLSASAFNAYRFIVGLIAVPLQKQQVFGAFRVAIGLGG
jgi:hypothetical protein